MDSGHSDLEAQVETTWPSAEPSMWRERAQSTVNKDGWIGMVLALWSPVTPMGLYSLSGPESLRSCASNPAVLGRMGRIDSTAMFPHMSLGERHEGSLPPSLVLMLTGLLTGTEWT